MTVRRVVAPPLVYIEYTAVVAPSAGLPWIVAAYDNEC
jgi:hypothetical protein